MATINAASMNTASNDSTWAEPRWSDDVDLYLGPRVPIHVVTAVVLSAAILALVITLALGL